MASVTKHGTSSTFFMSPQFVGSSSTTSHEYVYSRLRKSTENSFNRKGFSVITESMAIAPTLYFSSVGEGKDWSRALPQQVAACVWSLKDIRVSYLSVPSA